MRQSYIIKSHSRCNDEQFFHTENMLYFFFFLFLKLRYLWSFKSSFERETKTMQRGRNRLCEVFPSWSMTDVHLKEPSGFKGCSYRCRGFSFGGRLAPGCQEDVHVLKSLILFIFSGWHEIRCLSLMFIFIKCRRGRQTCIHLWWFLLQRNILPKIKNRAN